MCVYRSTQQTPTSISVDRSRAQRAAQGQCAVGPKDCTFQPLSVGHGRHGKARRAEVLQAPHARQDMAIAAATRQQIAALSVSASAPPRALTGTNTTCPATPAARAPIAHLLPRGCTMLAQHPDTRAMTMERCTLACLAFAEPSFD